MRPRSILVLTHELPPLGGGAGRAMAGLCAALAARGIDVEVWTQKPPARLAADSGAASAAVPADLVPPGTAYVTSGGTGGLPSAGPGRAPGPPYPECYPFRVRHFATGRARAFQTSIPTILLFCLRALGAGLRLGWRGPGGSRRTGSGLRALFTRFPRPPQPPQASQAPQGPGFDLVLSNTGVPTAVIGALLSRLFDARHAVWYHGADIHQNRREGAGRAYRAILKAAWRRTHFHGFVSRGLMEMAEGYGGMRGHRMMLPLFADAAPGASGAASGGGRSSRQADRVFLFAGRLEAVKDPFLFLSAVAWLIRSGRLPDDVRFRMVGGGALYRAVERRIRETGLSERVTLQPAVPGAAMSALYAGAFGLVLTSVVEGFPLTILEAARHGVPAVGPDTLGVNEEIEDGVTGLLFARGDAEACGRALLRLLEEDGLRDRLGAAARAAAEGFSADRTADLLLGALERS